MQIILDCVISTKKISQLILHQYAYTYIRMHIFFLVKYFPIKKKLKYLLFHFDNSRIDVKSKLTRKTIIRIHPRLKNAFTIYPLQWKYCGFDLLRAYFLT